MGGLGWLVGSVAQQVDEQRWQRFSGARSHRPGIWPVGQCWASTVGCAREQGGGQDGPTQGFDAEAKENTKGFSIFKTFL
jgi:hypothetical protein